MRGPISRDTRGGSLHTGRLDAESRIFFSSMNFKEKTGALALLFHPLQRKRERDAIFTRGNRTRVLFLSRPKIRDTAWLRLKYGKKVVVRAYGIPLGESEEPRELAQERRRRKRRCRAGGREEKKGGRGRKTKRW